MPVAPIPSAGTSTTASAQLLYQRAYVLGSATWGVDPISQPDNAFKLGGTLRVSGLPSIRFRILLYPEYDTGLGSFVARNYIQWRLHATLPPNKAPNEQALIMSNGGITYTPLTTPQTLPVGVPLTYDIPLGGAESLVLDFDTGAGTPANNQGKDLILFSVSAGV